MLKNIYISYDAREIRGLKSLISFVPVLTFNSILLHIDKISVAHLIKLGEFQTRSGISYALRTLCEDGVLTRLKNGVYIINPNLFFYGRGSNFDTVKKLYGMTVNKSSGWRKILNAYERELEM